MQVVITNNEGQPVTISRQLYEQLRQARTDGTWATLIHDNDNKQHMILLQTFI